MRILALVLAAATLSCAPPAIEYPVPPQRVLPASEPEVATVMMIKEPATAGHIVRDVLLGTNREEWVWTGQRPRLWAPVDSDTGWEFLAEFTVPGVILERLHQVTLTFYVNEERIGTHTYTKDGHYEFRAPVPATALAKSHRVVLGFDVEPVYVAEKDGAKLGVLLSGMGLRQAGKP